MHNHTHTNAVGHFDDAYYGRFFSATDFSATDAWKFNLPVVAAICVFLCLFRYSFLLPRYWLYTGAIKLLVAAH